MTKFIAPQLTAADAEILREETVYKGFNRLKIYQLRHRLFAGGWSPPFTRELLDRYRVAAALPYDPQRAQVVLIEQFRIGMWQDEHSPWSLEMVAGMMQEPEDLEAMVKREMQEEAGLLVQALLPICDYWVSPGGTNERVALYCAKVDASQAGGIHGLQEENEDIRVHVIAAADAFAMVESGRINNAATIIALQWLQLHQEKMHKKKA
jgi:ADP-ribose pyrophosphatase